MSFADDILKVFNEVLTDFEATAVFNGNTYSVMFSYERGSNSNMRRSGFDMDLVDLTAVFRSADIIGPAPTQNDIVTINGTDYVVSGEVKVQPALISIPLREI